MADKRVIKYGDQKVELPAGMTLEDAKEQMRRFFPELADPKVDTDKQKDGTTVYTFSKKAGTKGGNKVQDAFIRVRNAIDEEGKIDVAREEQDDEDDEE